MKRNVPNDVLRQIANTPTPLLAVQQAQPVASTAYSNVVAVNQNVQQTPPTALTTASAVNVSFSNTGITSSTVPAPMNTANVGNPQVITSSNASNANNSGVSSQVAPAYMQQPSGTQVNNQVSTPKPPQ